MLSERKRLKNYRSQQIAYVIFNQTVNIFLKELFWKSSAITIPEIRYIFRYNQILRRDFIKNRS